MRLIDAPGAAPHAEALSVEIPGNLLDAHARAVLAGDVQGEDISHESGFGLSDGQLLLNPVMQADLANVDGLVAIGRLGAVRITLPCILLHPTQDMLGGFFTLIFIKQHVHVALHLTAGVVLGTLANRDNRHPRPLQLAPIHGCQHQIAEETRQAMHDDRLTRRGLQQGVSHHRLEHGAFVVGRRSARFDILLDHGMP